jgi:biotin carboxyl carrier protein
VKRIVEIDGQARAVELAGNGLEWQIVQNGSACHASIVEVEPGVFSIVIEGRSYEARVLDGAVDIGGRKLPVTVTDLRSYHGTTGAQSAGGRAAVSSPMPGRVVRVLVGQGDSVEAGQGVVVVEAMKMQNEMKAPRAGRVVAVSAREGAAVCAGDSLVVIE